MDHVDQIKRGLGISGVKADVSSWVKKGNDEEKGAQIDLIIDRRDHVISLREMKFYSRPFEIDKDYDENLRTKAGTFRDVTKTNKTIQMVMITTFGVMKNKYSNYISRVIDLNALFENGE